MINFNGNDRKILRAAWQPQAIFSVIWGSVALLAAAKGISAHRTDLLYATVVCVFCGAMFVCWFRGFKLEIDGDNLLYSAPLARTVSVPLTEIRGIKFQRIVLGPKWRSSGYQIIVVELKGDTVPSVVLNARVFSQEGLNLFFNAIAFRHIPVIR
jgi:hypothetical protein